MPPSFTESQLLAGLLFIAVLSLIGGQARLLKVQRALGLEQLLASSFLFLPMGMLLSEAGFGLINRQVVRELEALVTLGLGVLGLQLGLSIDVKRVAADGRAVVKAAAVESLFTLALVGVPAFYLLEITGAGAAARAAAAALLGCAAAISGGESFATAARGEASLSPVRRVADDGTVAAVLAGGALIALLTPAGALGPLEKLLALAFIGTVGGLSAWLLASSTEEHALRTSLLIGILLVTAGTAAHLSLPPVAATLIAGIAIANLPGPLAGELRRNLAFLEGPLTVLLLVIAGASMQMPGARSLIVLALWLMLRTAGKILGGRAAAALSHGVLPARLGLGLLPSSSLAVGLALDFHSAVRNEIVDLVVTVTVLGSLLSETAGIWTTRLLARALALTDAVPASRQPGESTTPPTDPPQPEGEA